MTGGYHVRPIRHGDYGELMALANTDSSQPFQKKEILQWLRDSNVCLVAESKGILRGFVCYKPEGDQYTVTQLVTESSRSGPIAAALMGHIARHLWRAPVSKVSITVSDRDQKRMNALRRLGFKAARVQRGGESEGHTYQMVFSDPNQPLEQFPSLGDTLPVDNAFLTDVDASTSPIISPLSVAGAPQRDLGFLTALCDKLHRLTGRRFEIVSEDENGKLLPALVDGALEIRHGVFLRTAEEVAQPTLAQAKLSEHLGRRSRATPRARDLPGPVIAPSSWFRSVHLTSGADGALAEWFTPNRHHDDSSRREPPPRGR